MTKASSLSSTYEDEGIFFIHFGAYYINCMYYSQDLVRDKRPIETKEDYFTFKMCVTGFAKHCKTKVVAFIFDCALDEQTGKMSDILAIIDSKICVNLIIS